MQALQGCRALRLCLDTTASSITHRAAFGAIISRRAFGSRGSSSTRGASLSLLPSFSFRSLWRKRLWFSFLSPLSAHQSLKCAGLQWAIHGLIAAPHCQLFPSISRVPGQGWLLFLLPILHRNPLCNTGQAKSPALLKPPRPGLSSTLGLAPGLIQGSWIAWSISSPGVSGTGN